MELVTELLAHSIKRLYCLVSYLRADAIAPA